MVLKVSKKKEKGGAEGRGDEQNLGISSSFVGKDFFGADAGLKDWLALGGFFLVSLT